MLLVKPSHEIMAIMSNYATDDPLHLIELAGRTCYKSEDKMTHDSAVKFVKMIRDRGHESVIEHSAMTVKFVCDRGVTHELVRHRLCAFSQESTRYCNYSGGVTFVIPPWLDIEPGEYEKAPELDLDAVDCVWGIAMLSAERLYKTLVSNSWSPQQARSVLPNSLKAEIVVTANFREWRHIFKLRTSQAAHPQMREIMGPLLEEMKSRVPVIFEDL